MMTCRLLCALLVLALCCFSSFCAIEANEIKGDGAHNLNPAKPKPEVTNPVEQPPSKTPISPKIDVEERETESGENKALQTLQTTDKIKEKAESQSNLNQARDQEKDGKSTNEESDRDETDKANEQKQKSTAINTTTTTTTTTKAPTTTTTTTTAPEPPSTTTTEAPNTTTTRAPSHIRRIDGSLGSSAWVCSPLVLAVSALAYTAVG
ncbi:putative mucin TcMUCII [Trypanosoma cruzi]|nr:putative mucin TcMUCII [Trypanosoma cruzi]